MFPLVPPHVSTDLVIDLDAQLSRLGGCAVHVAPGPVLIGLGAADPLELEHPSLDSYLQAELIAARVNGLQGVSDAERTRLLTEGVGACSG